MLENHMIAIPGFSEPFSSLSHLLGALYFFISGFLLVHKGWGNKVRVASLIFYTFCLVFLFSMSGVYHLLEPGLTPRFVLRHLDHAGIWTLISGTITTIHFLLFRGAKLWGVIIPLWVITITGLTLEMVYFSSIPEYLALSFYLVLGWIGLYSTLAVRKHYKNKIFRYLIFGGISYTFGAILDFVQWPIIFSGVIEAHEVFHVFVLLGASFHWFFIYKYASNPISKKLKIAMSFNLKYSSNDLISSFEMVQVKGMNEKIYFSAKTKEDAIEKIESWKVAHYHEILKPKETLIFPQEYLE
ncbi:hemolysin III family protein [Bacteriovoracaceae bacterium]|nr:hemolysin III family protein [Bacteriovoracaceae bacterium]